MIQLNPLWLTAAVSVFIPLLVGLVTKSSATKMEKTLVNLLASAIIGGITTVLATNGAVRPGAWAMGVLVAFGSSVAAHYNLWKPTGIAAQIQNIAPGAGLGTATDPLVAAVLKTLGQPPVLLEQGTATPTNSPLIPAFLPQSDGSTPT